MDSYLTQEILSVLLELGLITQAEVEQKAADSAIKRVRDMVAENATAAALKKETESIKAAHSKDANDLITARASITSLSNQIETIKAEHEKAIQAVKDSVNVEVAKIVVAAGLPKPIKAETIASKDDDDTITRAAFESKKPAEQLAFIKRGGKIS